jgi:hypothetical protein
MNGGCEDTKWDTHVKAVQRGLNDTIHKTLGRTPAEVLFGCKPRSVAESILLSELQEELDRTDLTTLRKQMEDRVATDQAVQEDTFRRETRKGEGLPNRRPGHGGKN